MRRSEKVSEIVSRDCSREHQNPDGLAFEGGKVKERGTVELFAFVLDFPLLVLQVKDGTSLRVVERG